MPGASADAAADYALLVEQRPDDAYVRYWAGMAHLGSGDCAGARPHFDVAVRLQPAWGQAHIALTRTAASCGDDNARRSARQRALQLLANNDNADTRLTLAIAELGLGRADAARDAIAALPDEAKRWLGEALGPGSTAKGAVPTRLELVAPGRA